MWPVYILRRRLIARQMMWASRSILPSLVPASALHYATPISGSPIDATILSQGDDFPSTDVHTEELDGVAAEKGTDVIMQEEVCSVCLTWTDTPCDRLLNVMRMELGLPRTVGFCFGG